MTKHCIKEIESLCREQNFHPSELQDYVKGLCQGEGKFKDQNPYHILSEVYKNLRENCPFLHY